MLVFRLLSSLDEGNTRKMSEGEPFMNPPEQNAFHHAREALQIKLCGRIGLQTWAT